MRTVFVADDGLNNAMGGLNSRLNGGTYQAVVGAPSIDPANGTLGGEVSSATFAPSPALVFSNGRSVTSEFSKMAAFVNVLSGVSTAETIVGVIFKNAGGISVAYVALDRPVTIDPARPAVLTVRGELSSLCGPNPVINDHSGVGIIQ